jgi:Arc/MetJ-type ribon-helix-helix transcriptional regulator
LSHESQDKYKESVRDWREKYKEVMNEWKETMNDWKNIAKSSFTKGRFPPFPPLPLPHPLKKFSLGTRSKVVASRIGNKELRVIDMLIEAGLFNTRSEAVAYLVGEGIKARKDIVEKVTSTLKDIRRIRQEAEEYILNLRKDIGLEKVEVIQNRLSCKKCGKDLSKIPKDIKLCPYCGLKKK